MCEEINKQSPSDNLPYLDCKLSPRHSSRQPSHDLSPPACVSSSPVQQQQRLRVFQRKALCGFDVNYNCCCCCFSRRVVPRWASVTVTRGWPGTSTPRGSPPAAASSSSPATPTRSGQSAHRPPTPRSSRPASSRRLHPRWYTAGDGEMLSCGQGCKLTIIFVGDLSPPSLTPTSSGEPQLWAAAPRHSLEVSGSTSHRATVDGQLPPRLVTVFRRVM